MGVEVTIRVSIKYVRNLGDRCYRDLVLDASDMVKSRGFILVADRTDTQDNDKQIGRLRASGD
jgi:hypothetical protein